VDLVNDPVLDETARDIAGDPLVSGGRWVKVVEYPREDPVRRKRVEDQQIGHH